MGAGFSSPPREAGVAAGPASAGLLERTRELDALSAALAAARRGSGGVVVVEGAAGIGKSRLLDAAGDEAGATGMGVLTARGLELEREVPFGVAVELLAAPLAAASRAQRARLLGGQAGLAGFLLDPAQPPSAEPQALVRGLYWLTVNLAGRRPLAVMVDDAQWADRPSLTFLAHLAMRLDGVPLTLVLARRSGEVATAPEVLAVLRDAPGCTLLAPAALSEAAVGRLVGAELPGAEPAFAAACSRVSGGNPFLTRELARALRADGVRPDAASVPRVEQLVPGSVLHALLTRLARLDASAQRVAAAVAVLGDGARLRHVAALADVPAREAEEAADALGRLDILAPGEPLRFAHPLIATTVHSDLPPFARARAHRAAAELIAADGAPVQEVAAHLLLSTPAGDPWTVATLREAAGRAVAHGDPRAAARLLERALAEPPAPGERARVLLELAEAEGLQGDAAATGHATEALALLDEPGERALALRVLSRLQFALGDHVAGAAALREVLAGIDASDPIWQEVLADYLTVTTFRATLQVETRARMDPVVEAARAGSPPSDPRLLAHLALQLALAGEDPLVVRDLAERATAGDPLVDLGTHGMLMGMLVQALCSVDELDLAERLAGDALEAARRRGSLTAATVASFHRAIPRHHRGELADAVADLDQARTLGSEGFDAGVAWVRALQVHVHLERGEIGAARGALAPAAPLPDSMDGPIVRIARSRLALFDRDPAAALEDALAAGRELDGEFGIDHPGFVPWRRAAAIAALASGDARRARGLAAEELALARSCGVPRAIALALRTQAAVSDGAPRIDLLAEAASVLDSSRAELERAHVLSELGGALRRAGRRADARVPLRRALQLADRMGAVPLAEAARAELRATGARPRRAAFTGVDALTPAERRVAQLAAEGLTNTQIAQSLFVTTKTVQTHLARVYRKLDIASRRQLPAALGA